MFVSQGELPAFDSLAQLGFKDLQDIAAERWGILPQATCKSRTRKDFCYISPEMQDLLVQVSVIDDLWPDHAVVQGHFHRLRQSVPRDVWFTPKPFPWPPNLELPEGLWNCIEGDVDAKYMQLWRLIEDRACSQLPFPVSKQVRGRAQTTATKAVKSGKFAPIKVGRHGEFQPHFHGSSIRYAQWVRQVRRLQAFCRCRTDVAVPSQHSIQVWGSVMKASGFVGGFAHWWMSCPLKVHGAPTHLPWIPPCLEAATKIFESFVMNVREFEKQLKSTSRQYARLRRAQQPNMIFTDLKSSPTAGVDYLLQSLTADVVEVRDDLSVVVDPPQQWSPDHPVMCQGRSFRIIHAEDDCLWLDQVDHIAAGMIVSQLRSTGTKQDLERAFVDAWKARWERHRDVPYERWQTILGFAKHHLRPVSMQWPSIDADLFTQIVGRKRRASAGGLDGVTVADLQQMPLNAIEAFCDIFRSAEISGEWPSQLLLGKVVCLAKTDHPSSVGDYRPITILSMLYRIWSSYQAQLAIRALDRSLPDTLYGCRPARFAGQVWSQLLWAVESSVSNGVALTGLIADLQKAFNHIPRIVVFEAAALMGLPMPMLTAWAGALAKVGRRFQIGPNLTKPVFSSTGLPEGDGLSCLGMLIVDVLFHKWHVHFFPLCQPVSYVDDWTILTTAPSMLEGIQHCLQRFTEALDMMLDAKKTFAWSVCSEGRTSLVTQGFQVEQSCRVLGAHVQISQKHTNATQMKRIDTMQGMWSRLRLSASPYELKVRAIRTAAWPRALHAIAATTLAAQTFSSLRAAAMKGLQAAGAGCNAMIQLGLIEQVHTDPQFWSILQTVRLVRDCGIAEVVGSALSALVHDADGLMRNGISATLLTRLQTLGWHVRGPGCLVDDFGHLSLFEVCMDELRWRMEWSWLKVVAASVTHRPGLCELDRVDPGRTRRWLSSLSVADRAAYRKLLNGAHITQDAKHHCQESDSDVCEYCQCVDSRFHRFWICEAFQQHRVGLCDELRAYLPQLPECVSSYGWALRPTTSLEWYSYLNQVVPLPLPPLPACDHDLLHVFTDGSCYNPAYPDTRFASYAIVSADPAMKCMSQILDSGPLPGLRQTSVRAELYAVHRLVRMAAQHNINIMIWSDCLAVVRRLQRILGGVGVKINSPNADLWMLIQNDLQNAGFTVQCTKVAAHQNLEDASSPLEEWCFRHNQFADHAATLAQDQRPSSFWSLLQRHVIACKKVDAWNAQIQEVLLKVNRQILQQQDHAEPKPEIVPMPPPDVPHWKSLPELTELPHGAVRWYGLSIVRKMVDWFWPIVFDPQTPTLWVSYAQLFVDYGLATGEVGPLNNGGWLDGSSLPLQGLLSIGFKRRVRSFAKVLREILRHSGATVSSAYVRPHSEMIAMFSSCLAVPWPA